MSKKYYSESKQYDFLGQYIRDKRKSYGITQQELADSIDMSVRQLIRFENGTPINSNYLIKIFFMLKISAIWGVMKQVKEFKETDQSIEKYNEVQRKVLSKSWGL